ncbi:hypothetical protein J3R83DRAFT_1611 [Lanmaoa asiatica]|nr:hypothetical protein J3R83DRAFT_1611 [Lanmaoa asiatica]
MRGSTSHSTTVSAAVRPAAGSDKILIDVFAVYCNTLLATLNARKGLNGASRNDDMSLSFQGHTAQQKTNHSMIGTSSRVGFLRDSVKHWSHHLINRCQTIFLSRSTLLKSTFGMR